MNGRMRRYMWLLAALSLAAILIVQGILLYRIQIRLVWLESNAEWRTDRINDVFAEQDKLRNSLARIERTLIQNRE